MPKLCPILRTPHDPERVDHSPQIDLVERQRQHQTGWNHGGLFLVAHARRDERISGLGLIVSATASREEGEGQRNGDGAGLGEPSLLWSVTLECKVAQCARLTDHVLLIGGLLPESNEARTAVTGFQSVARPGRPTWRPPELDDCATKKVSCVLPRGSTRSFPRSRAGGKRCRTLKGRSRTP